MVHQQKEIKMKTILAESLARKCNELEEKPCVQPLWG
jgi:hypothetical protein